MRRLVQGLGVLYVLAWVAGLLMGAPDVPDGARSADVWDRVHGSGAMGLQALLVHGVAGALLVAIASVGSLLRMQRTARPELGAIMLWTGVVAGMVSIFQFVLELTLVLGWFGASADSAGAIWQVVQVIDGLKMLALAGFVLALGYVGGESLRFPAWAQALAVTAALALMVSGVGYTISRGWALEAATVSLPLLLGSVAVSCVLEGRSSDGGVSRPAASSSS